MVRAEPCLWSVPWALDGGGESHCQRLCKCFRFQNIDCSKTKMSCKILGPKACKIQNILTKTVFQYSVSSHVCFWLVFFILGKSTAETYTKIDRERSGQLLIARFDFYTKPRRWEAQVESHHAPNVSRVVSRLLVLHGTFAAMEISMLPWVGWR